MSSRTESRFEINKGPQLLGRKVLYVCIICPLKNNPGYKAIGGKRCTIGEEIQKCNRELSFVTRYGTR